MDPAQYEIMTEIEDRYWWFRCRREIFFDTIRRFVPPGRNRTVAEIGCATGGNLRMLKDGYTVIGVDTSPEAVRHASAGLAGRVFQGDFREVLRDRWGEIDVVLLADVLEHVDDDVSFLSDIVRRLPAGAIVVVSVPAHPFLWSRHDVVLGHRRRYTAGGLRRLWSSLPVEERLFTPFNCLLFPPIALLRLSRRGGGGKDLYLYRSDRLNALLYGVFSLERHFLRWFRLPFGVSYLAVLRTSGDRDAGRA